MASKLLIACFRGDDLACATLEQAIALIGYARNIDYGNRWKNEAGCKQKCIDPREMNPHPVFLIGEGGMNFASFEARNNCTRGEGIIVVTHGSTNIPLGMKFIPPYRFFKGLRLVDGENIAGLRKVVLLDPAEGRGDGYRRVLTKHAATTISISMETEAAAMALFPDPEAARESRQILAPSSMNA